MDIKLQLFVHFKTLPIHLCQNLEVLEKDRIIKKKVLPCRYLPPPDSS